MICVAYLHRPSVRHALISALSCTVGLLTQMSARGDVTPPALITLADIASPVGDVALAPGFPSTGWDLRETIVTYNTVLDVLQVRMKFTGIAGDADGSGNPGGNDPRLAAAGGVNPANLGGLDSITAAFASLLPGAGNRFGAPIAIAGVPEYKLPNVPSGLDGFRLAQYATSNSGLATSYGNAFTDSRIGAYLFWSPSAANPDFVFNIVGFSHIPGIDTTRGFYYSSFAGSPNDVVAGEDGLGWTFIPFPGPQGVTPPPVPEPTSLALIALGGFGLWFGRRSIRRKSQSGVDH